MRFGEIKCHEINSQYPLKNTSCFHYNGLRPMSPRTIFTRDKGRVSKSQVLKCDMACRTLRRGASHSRFRNRALLYSMRPF